MYVVAVRIQWKEHDSLSTASRLLGENGQNWPFDPKWFRTPKVRHTYYRILARCTRKATTRSPVVVSSQTIPFKQIVVPGSHGPNRSGSVIVALHKSSRTVFTPTHRGSDLVYAVRTGGAAVLIGSEVNVVVLSTVTSALTFAVKEGSAVLIELTGHWLWEGLRYGRDSVDVASISEERGLDGSSFTSTAGVVTGVPDRLIAFRVSGSGVEDCLSRWGGDEVDWVPEQMEWEGNCELTEFGPFSLVSCRPIFESPIFLWLEQADEEAEEVGEGEDVGDGVSAVLWVKSVSTDRGRVQWCLCRWWLLERWWWRWRWWWSWAVKGDELAPGLGWLNEGCGNGLLLAESGKQRSSPWKNVKRRK